MGIKIENCQVLRNVGTTEDPDWQKVGVVANILRHGREYRATFHLVKDAVPELSPVAQTEEERKAAYWAMKRNRRSDQIRRARDKAEWDDMSPQEREQLIIDKINAASLLAMGRLEAARASLRHNS